jgi:hypothetical protein
MQDVMLHVNKGLINVLETFEKFVSGIIPTRFSSQALFPHFLQMLFGNLN